MQAENSGLNTHKELKINDINTRRRNKKLKKAMSNGDESEARDSSDEDEKHMSNMSSSSSDSDSSLSSLSSDSSILSQKKKRKSLKRKKTKSSSDSESDSSSSSGSSLSSSELSFSDSDTESTKPKVQNLEEGEIDEQDSKSPSRPISPTHGLDNLKKIKSEIANAKKKMKSLESEIKNLNKKLKAHPSSKKIKQKKKLEKKLLAYKSRINGLSTRQNILINKNPNLEQFMSPKRKHKSKKGSRKEKRSKSPSQLQNSVKIPYPVLNDKRDMNVIFDILIEKQKNLNEMFAKTCHTLEHKDKFQIQDPKEAQSKITRLTNLKENIKLQLQRLNRQLDYVKLNLEIHKFEKALHIEQEYDVKNNIKRRMEDLKRQNEDLLNQMKDANKRALNGDNRELAKDLEPKIETKPPVSVSALPVNYRNNPPPLQPHNLPNAPPQKIQNFQSMTPPTSSASSSSSSSSLSNRPQQSYPRAQVRTPPLPNHPIKQQNQVQNFENKFYRQQESHMIKTPPQNVVQNMPPQAHINNQGYQRRHSMSPPIRPMRTQGFNNNQNNNVNGVQKNFNGNTMPNFENMFQNPQFIKSMMNMVNDGNMDNTGNGLLPCPPNMPPLCNNPNSQMFSMFHQYFQKFASGLGLGNLSQNQVFSIFQSMQQNGNFTAANQMMMNKQMMQSNNNNNNNNNMNKNINNNFNSQNQFNNNNNQFNNNQQRFNPNSNFNNFNGYSNNFRFNNNQHQNFNNNNMNMNMNNRNNMNPNFDNFYQNKRQRF